MFDQGEIFVDFSLWKFPRVSQYSTARAPGNNNNNNNSSIMAYSTTSQGGAVAAMYVNGVCVRSGVTERGEVRDQPGQVVGGQQGGNRNDLRKKCQEYEVFFQQLPQAFDQFKEVLEAPLLAEIARLEEVNKQLRQKTVGFHVIYQQDFKS